MELHASKLRIRRLQIEEFHASVTSNKGTFDLSLEKVVKIMRKPCNRTGRIYD